MVLVSNLAPTCTRLTALAASRPLAQPPRAAAQQAPSPTARVPAGPQAVSGSPVPDYTALDRLPLNRVMMHHFTRRFEDSVGEKSPLGGYDAIVWLTGLLNAKGQRPAQDIQFQALQLFTTLLPAWLPPFFRAVFTGRAPQLAARLNAFFTTLTCQWLMGPSTMADYKHSSGEVRRGQAVKIERCRYLESTGCASVCLNCCKVPTQAYIQQHMGLPLRITPNYSDFSCEFAFGEAPLPPDQDPAFASPCFAQCPSARPHRRQADCGGTALAEMAPQGLLLPPDCSPAAASLGNSFSSSGSGSGSGNGSSGSERNSGRDSGRRG